MKLYYFPGACSLASNIALHEAGIAFDLARVDKKTKRVDGVDFYTINPKGYVPALKLDSGEVLAENVVVLQYIADQNPQSHLAPPLGTLERYHLMEWLSFINSEVHKSFTPLYAPDASDDMKAYAKKVLADRLAYVEKALGSNKFLMGDQFTIADAYLFTVLSWSGYVGVEVSPKLKEYSDRIRARPRVLEALHSEGLKVKA